ncbi:MAG: hypothetical protein ACRDF7_00430 [Candidatus Limnocylindrales bacterium]
MSQPKWQPLGRVIALALVAFVLAHDLIFLIAYGTSFASALARSGHDSHWTATVIVVAELALALLVAGGARLIRLRRVARSLPAGRAASPDEGWRGLPRQLVRGWLAVFALTLAVFLGAENLERVNAGLPAPGLGVLDTIGYPGSLLILAATSLLVAFVEALYRWRRDALVARIEAARQGWSRAARSTPGREWPWVERRHGSIAAHRIAGRAPPSGAAS